MPEDAPTPMVRHEPRKFEARRWLRSFRLGVVVLCLDFSAQAQAGGEFESKVRPLLAKYCFECHGANGTKKAEVDFEPFKSEEQLSREPSLWLEVLAQLRSAEMPPSKAAQPTDADRRFLISWLEQTLDGIFERAPQNPGRVPVHRLNRVEYNNTIRDLIGLDLRPAEAFPADDTAHGFDNVAEVLALPPMLLEKYLDAAEKVFNHAIVPGGKVELLERNFQGAELPKARVTNEVAELKLEQEIGATMEVPQTGEYEISVQASQHGAGDAPATLVLKIDGVDTQVWGIPEEGQPTLLKALVPLRAGSRRVSLRHTWHMEMPKEKKVPDARLWVEWLKVSGPVQALAHHRIFQVEPGPKLSEREAARTVLERFAFRAFRRPVEPGELERLLLFYEQARQSGRTFVEAMRLPLVSVLVSPQFLFRIERDHAVRDEVGAVRLNDWELASRLSYFLWSSMPDEELFRLAREKQLRQPAVLRQQVTRMLADPKSRALAENFAGQWLGLRRLEAASPDPGLFPGFKPGLKRAMLAEVEEFFLQMMREDRNILEFVNADWTMLNEELARHYGIKEVLGGHVRPVKLTNSVRGGVMTMAAVLTVTSHPTRTSAVKRGKWVLEEILGAPPPPPPPNVPELEVPAKGQAPATTLRERLERHRSDPKCSGCHVRMDALGLGLENFDATGRWREKEGGHKIVASGVLPGGESFAGPVELKNLLASHGDEFRQNLVEKMFVYAVGRNLEHFDRREVRRVKERLASAGGKFSTLVSEIVLSYPFIYRRATELEEAANQSK